MFLSGEIMSAIAGYDGRAEFAAQLPAEFSTWDPFCQSQYLEMSQLLPGYILSSQGDRVAMAHGIESRFPFLDPEVVQFASTLPPTQKMKALREKYLLKQIARDLVPADVWRRSKQPYRAPGASALLTASRAGYIDDLLAPSQLRHDAIFDEAAVQRLVRKCRERSSLSIADDMALVGIISTQLIVHRFINHFPTVTHGTSYSGTADLHR
jgi:asparagine synthase (glutamine-hydrolysing)